VLFASLAGFVYIVATSDGLNDSFGRPLGTDFSNVYAAGTYVLDGHAEAPFDPARQFAREQEIFGFNTQFYGWHYPPFFLFVAALLALMPYAVALAVWQSVTFALYLLSIRSILCMPSSPAGLRDEKIWLLLAGAFPAVFVNLGHGHNGFLTAALIGLALVMLGERPILAGILFGLLAYKPQFGLMIPLVLIASGRWRAFFAASATVIVLAALTTLVFGPQIWTAFLDSMHFTRTIVLEAGETGWHKIQSVFSWVRMWGGPVPLAYAVQGIVTIAAAVALIWLWRGPVAFALKASALAVAAILATPYSLDYDMMVLAPAIAFLAADGLTRGFSDYEKSALAALWLVPLVARSIAAHVYVPLGVIAMLAVFVLVILRAWNDSKIKPAA